MMHLGAYKILGGFRLVPGARLCRALRGGDGAEVLMRTPSSGNRREIQRRLERAVELCRDLSADSLCPPTDVVTVDGTPWAVYPTSGRTTLSERLQTGPLSSQQTLEAGAGLADALEALHVAELVHGDVRPDNVVIDETDGSVRLLCGESLGTADELPPIELDADEPQPVLPYAAPERLGRLAAPLDARSDLYALGLTLCELLAGRHPFPLGDVVALVHAHVARRPTCRTMGGVSLAPLIDAIVTKLASKHPDDRYQTAHGAAHDLRRAASHTALCPGDPSFVLATEDTPTSFRVPARLYGRERERSALEVALADASAGASHFVSVAGPSGIGKSALVESLRAPAMARRGLFAAGKADAVADVPFCAFVRAFRGLVRQILLEPESELVRWQTRLTDTLGELVPVVTELLPDLARIVGPQPPPEPLPSRESLARFHLAYQRLVDAFAQPTRPLVLFLDDLQWADAATLEFLERLFPGSESGALLVVGAYRSEEVGATHPLTTTLERLSATGCQRSPLELAPLTHEDVLNLLAETLHGDRTALDPLAAAVRERTEGNPFFLHQFLTSLHESDVIRYVPGTRRWRWSVSSAKRAGVTAPVAETVIRRIAQLPEVARVALVTAAHVSSRVRTSTLAASLEIPEKSVRERLEPAIELGLMLHTPDSEGRVAHDRYQFVHDRVQEAARGLVPSDERETLDLRIGRLLAPATPEDAQNERIFEAANHLLRGVRLVSAAAERRKLGRLLLEAGRRARQAAGHAAALRYFSAGLELLPDAECPDHETRRALRIGHAETLGLTGDQRASEAAFQALLEEDLTRDERRTVTNHYVALLLNQGRGADAAALGFQAMAPFGFVAPTTPEGWHEAANREMAELQRAIEERGLETLREAPTLTDPERTAEVERLAVLAPGAYHDPDQFRFSAMRAANLSLRHGVTPYTPIGYGLSGLLFCAFGQMDVGYALGALSVELARERGLPVLEPHVVFLYSVFIKHGRDPYEECLPLIEEAFARALAVGSLPYAAWLAMNRVFMVISTGTPIPQALEILDRHVDDLRRFIRNRDILHILFATRRVLCALAGRRRDLAQLDADGHTEETLLARLEHYAAGTAACHFQALMEATIMGDLERALSLGAAIRDRQMAIALPGSHLVPESRLWQGLTHARAAQQAQDETTSAAHRARLAEEHQALTAHAAGAPSNHEAAALLLAAEIAALDGAEDASAAYDAAIDAARSANRPHVEALAAEQAGRYHLAAGRARVGRYYLSAAQQGYASWGAAHKVAELAAEFPSMAAECRRPESAAPLDAALDRETLTRAAEAVVRGTSTADVLANLLRVAVENSGAEFGWLMLEDERAPLRARFVGEGVDRHLRVDANGPSPSTDEDPPDSALCLVARTRSWVVERDARQSGSFCDDPVVGARGIRSMLCAPLESRGALLGRLYLENALAPDVFAPARVETLRVLVSIAASSLESARLYDGLKETKQALEVANQELAGQRAALAVQVRERTQELATLHRLYETLLASVEDAICGLDPQGRITFANRAATELFRVAAEDLVGRPFAELAGREVQLPTDANADRTRRPGEATFRRPDGDSFVAEWDVQPLRDEPADSTGDKQTTRTGQVVTLRDVTIRRKLEDEVRNAQKLEAVGQFAGGLAHEFNNLLTPVLGNVALVREELDEDDAHARLLGDAALAGRRMAALVQQMSAFSRQSGLDRSATDLVPVVEEVVRFVRRSVDRTIAFDWSPGPGALWFHGNAGLLHQVLLNLCLNARDAVTASDGRVTPRVTLSAAEVTVSEDEAGRRPGARAGRFVELVVQDNGVGMDRRTRERAFEPFFSTKDVGNGTGLGLAVVHGIVRQHGGWIELETAPGEGARFACYLPASDAPEPPKRDEAPAHQPRRAGTVLVIDDEQLVLEVSQKLLERGGWTVHTAISEDEAYAAFERHHDALDAVIADLTLANASGLAIAAELRRRAPDLHIVVWSGYDLANTAQDLDTDCVDDFVTKPFERDTLLAALEPALE